MFSIKANNGWSNAQQSTLKATKPIKSSILLNNASAGFKKDFRCPDLHAVF